ncbi:MAG: serine/threonine protein kinase [Vulcanimicrobiota bacterium]
MFAPQTIIANRYEVIRLIGQGGMSNLYLCRDRKYNNAIVVIKEMTAVYSDPNEQQMAVNLFHREAKLLASLNHRHIPKVFDYFQYQGKYYLSMEYVDGDDLGKQLSERPGPMAERDVAELGSQMATVLYYLHVHKPPIVFRDVKPSNIMMTKDGVKLIDFGIARHFDVSKKGDTMRIGSPGYAPPEQYSGQTDPRSDIYALGVTLHHALTGRDPTTTQTPFLLPPPRDLNPQVSQRMADIITRATRLDPSDRYQNMLEMKRDLKTILTGQTGGTRVVAGPPGNSATVPHSGPPPVPNPAASSATPAVSATPAGAQNLQNQATQPPANATPPPRPSKLSGVLLVAFLLLIVGGATFAAVTQPELFQRGRENLALLWAHYSAGQLPTDPAEAAQRLYLDGGSLALAYARLQEAPAESHPPVLENNLLATMSGHETLAVGVLVEADDNAALAGLALAQRDLNGQGGVDGKLVVLQVMTAGDDPARAFERLAAGAAGRRNPEGEATRPAWIVVTTGVQGVNPEVPTFGLAEDSLGEGIESLPEAPSVLAKAAKKVAKEPILWLHPDDPGPVTVTREAPPTSPDQALALLGKAGQGTVVVAADQAKPLLEALGGLPGPELLLVADSVEQLPEARSRTRALVSHNGLSRSEYADRFWRLAPPDAPRQTARCYDLLTWAALFREKTRTYRGVTVSIKSGESPQAPPFAMLVPSQDGKSWVYQDDIEVQP